MFCSCLNKDLNETRYAHWLPFKLSPTDIHQYQQRLPEYSDSRCVVFSYEALRSLTPINLLEP
jgi:hypothetical protein